MLQSAGLALNHITHVHVFLMDMRDFDEVNRAYVEMMGEHRPARTVIGVNELPEARHPADDELNSRDPGRWGIDCDAMTDSPGAAAVVFVDDVARLAAFYQTLANMTMSMPTRSTPCSRSPDCS